MASLPAILPAFLSSFLLHGPLQAALSLAFMFGFKIEETGKAQFVMSLRLQQTFRLYPIGQKMS